MHLRSITDEVCTYFCVQIVKKKLNINTNNNSSYETDN